MTMAGVTGTMAGTAGEPLTTHAKHQHMKQAHAQQTKQQAHAVAGIGAGLTRDAVATMAQAAARNRGRAALLTGGGHHLAGGVGAQSHAGLVHRGSISGATIAPTGHGVGAQKQQNQKQLQKNQSLTGRAPAALAAFLSTPMAPSANVGPSTSVSEHSSGVRSSSSSSSSSQHRPSIDTPPVAAKSLGAGATATMALAGSTTTSAASGVMGSTTMALSRAELSHLLTHARVHRQCARQLLRRLCVAVRQNTGGDGGSEGHHRRHLADANARESPPPAFHTGGNLAPTDCDRARAARRHGSARLVVSRHELQRLASEVSSRCDIRYKICDA